ncbi:hypothetical protein FHS27_004294 [Rhodopirellula rubra]|uniref:HNH domain-containing protein n=1 Tax=Aporhodopirellula rubra TaxID=980271 RepID=A0A7W5H7W5_9BACT|nr:MULTISPECIES: HNH endonuclease [Aporhodopirellula]EMI45745.1 HNH endonuclease [Rhodopirellula sp. SWK7]MBB3208465.1 hypothetical protein [Aporhodopirellula rubra]
MKRERWGQVTAEYELDHFQPQTLHPDLELSYDNLVYACRRCNNVKRAQAVDDPFAVATSGHLKVLGSGELLAISGDAIRLVRVLDLNAEIMIQWREMWLRIAELAEENDPVLYRNLFRFPEDIPRLDRLIPTGGNARPDGVVQSWFARQERDELPESY